jgi:hypothetical protein
MPLRPGRTLDVLKRLDTTQAYTGDTIAIPLDLLRDIRGDLLLAAEIVNGTRPTDPGLAEIITRDRERLLTFVPYITD